MKKVISIILCVIVILIGSVFVIGNVKDTAYFSGVLNGTDTTVDIKIIRTIFDKAFNKMSEYMIVDGSGIEYRYIFNGKIFDMDKYYAAPIRRMGDSGLATQGYLFFDDEMRNIVIETEQEVIFSCEKEFLNMVIK